MNSFTMVGKIVPIKDTGSFKGYEEKTYSSGWMTQTLRWNFVCGDNRHLVSIDAGRWKDDAKNSVIYTYSRGTSEEKSKPIQIPWSKRNDTATINEVSGFKIFTIDTDTKEHRDEVTKSGDAKAIEESNKNERHFLAASDFCDLARKLVYSDKIKDWVFKIQGNIVYSYSEKTGKYYSLYEVTKIYRVDESTTPYSNASIDFYYAENFIDKDSIEDSGKAIMSGFTPFYDSVTKKTWFAPISIVMRSDKDTVDVTEDVLNEFSNSEICKAVLSCKIINGAQKVDVKVSDLSEKVQKAIAAGIMDERQAIYNAGGQMYGERIQEIRFNKISKNAEATVYTLENCTATPHKPEEPVDIFANDNEDDI